MVKKSNVTDITLIRCHRHLNKIISLKIMNTLMTVLVTIFKPILSNGVKIVWENRNFLSLYFKTKYGNYRNKEIRFSLSGLYKIQIPNSNKYLLVFNRRIANQLQPVGGAYKRFEDENLFNRWSYKPDNARNGLDVDFTSSGDLRFMVKGKNVIDVLTWFASSMGRELDPRREFKEELLDSGILDSANFNFFNHKIIRRFSKNLFWSEHFSCFEILVLEVFELIPNEAQKKELIELAKKPFDPKKGYAIVSCDDIEQLRLMQEGVQIARIGQHSKLLINKSF